MKHYPLLTIPALLLSLFSCNREPVETVGAKDVSAKILPKSEAVVEDAFLVKFVSAPGDEALSDFEKTHGVNLKRIFRSTPGKESLEKEFGLDRWYESTVPGNTSLDEMVLKAAAVPEVQLVQYENITERVSNGKVYGLPETKGTVDGAFNDPYLSKQWHYKNVGDKSVSSSALAGADINVTPVWNSLTCGDPAIVVAVVDEGVKYTHPDLKDNMWVNTKEIPGNGIDDDGNGYIDDVYGYNFVTGGSIEWTAEGNSGHGTHCAGTIAAVNNNGKGVAGVAGGSGKGDGCRIMSCQIFSGKAGGTVSAISKAIKYAADNGASIISCSFGSTKPFASDNAYYNAGGGAEVDAIHYFEACKNNPVLNGNIAIFAASNDAKDFAYYPGATHDIISVSALGPDGLPAYYTNYGPGCNICAPGGEAYHNTKDFGSMVLSTMPSEVPTYGLDGQSKSTGNDYGYMQGTSMACPHVSGVVALALSYAKQLGKTFDREEFKRMILSSVNDVDQLIARTSEKTYAYGRGPLKMAPYYHQMGTGSIDAWRLMMKIEGTPTSTAKLGQKQWIDLTSTFGTASVSLTYLKVEVSDETVAALGLQKIKGTGQSNYPSTPEGEAYAYVQFGRLYIHPTKIGSGKIAITAVGGGSHVGGGDNPPGGMELEQDLSIIVRDTDGGNGTGGWL